MLMRPYRSLKSPMREIDRLRREMNRVFTDWPALTTWRRAPGYPAMNVWTDEDNAIVTAELPGFDSKDIHIAIENDTLNLQGSRQPDELGEGVTYHRRERQYGTFSRSFRLPFQVDAGKVDATLVNGVLTISLPRAEADKPKTITVKAG